MVKPVIGMGIKLGKPRVSDERVKRSERLDAKVREGEDVAAYQRRILRKIKSSKGEDEPKL